MENVLPGGGRKHNIFPDKRCSGVASFIPPSSHLSHQKWQKAPFCNLQVMTLSCSSRELSISSTSHVWLFSGLTQVVCAKRSGAAICSRDANYCLHEAAENRALEHVCMAVN